MPDAPGVHVIVNSRSSPAEYIALSTCTSSALEAGIVLASDAEVDHTSMRGRVNKDEDSTVGYGALGSCSH